MIPVAIAGVAGQMGRMLVELITMAPDIELIAGFEHPDHPKVGADSGTNAGVSSNGVTISPFSTFLDDSYERRRKVEVLIDFSVPDMTRTICERSASYGVGIVVGTTGQEDEDLKEIKKVSNVVPFLMAPNMSVGVNITFDLIDRATQAMAAQTDVEIYEMHHNLKIDSPSGTAKRMGEIVAEARGKNLDEVAIYGRQGTTGRRIGGAIGFHSARGGDVVGDHTVTFAGDGERIEITHRAHSRSSFASGALRAARFIHGKLQEGAVGAFDMKHVLGID